MAILDCSARARKLRSEVSDLPRWQSATGRRGWVSATDERVRGVPRGITQLLSANHLSSLMVNGSIPRYYSQHRAADCAAQG